MQPSREDNSNHRWPPLFPVRTWQKLVRELRLSKRQAEVAALLCRECFASEIAVELGISRDAVRHHSKALFRKLGVKSRLGVVLKALHECRNHRRPSSMRVRRRQ